jgi:aminoglycoside N3'-acetyltransferase
VIDVQARLYSLVKQVVPPGARRRLLAWQRDLRRIGAPLIRRVYGTFGPEDLYQDLVKRLPADFEVLMVHISMDSLYPMFTGTAFDVLSLLRRLVGERTLAMPAFVFGKESFDPIRRYRVDPVFDVRKTPSEMGLVTELFRRSRSVRRSLHPTHSLCASGPLAEIITAGHDTCGSTFGEGSPFARLDDYRTVILGVGTYYFRSMTHIRRIEPFYEAGSGAGLTPRADVTPVTLIDAKGDSHRHIFRTVPADALHFHTELLRGMLAPGELQEWRFHGAPFFSVEAAAVTRAIYDNARRGRMIYEPR